MYVWSSSWSRPADSVSPSGSSEGGWDPGATAGSIEYLSSAARCIHPVHLFPLADLHPAQPERRPG